jgi:hypothetical protein
MPARPGQDGGNAMTEPRSSEDGVCSLIRHRPGQRPHLDRRGEYAARKIGRLWEAKASEADDWVRNGRALEETSIRDD